MGALSWEEAEFLLQIARDASLGGTFNDRFSAISESVLALIPGVALSAALIEPDPSGPRGRALFRNHEPDSLAQYLAHYQASDPMGHGIAEARGTALTLSDCVGAREFGRDAFTGELLPRLGVRHILGLALQLPRGEKLAISLHRAREQRDFSAHERRLLELVSEDLGRAALGSLLRERLAALARENEAAFEPRAGALVLDGRGGVLFADPGAQHLLRRHADAVKLELLDADARRLARAGEADELERLWPLGAEGALRATLSALRGGGRAGQVLVVLELLRRPSDGVFDELAERAGLTARQRDVVRLAITGEGNQGIAHRLGISRVTVGVHLSKAYKKLGVAGRVELAALLGGS